MIFCGSVKYLITLEIISFRDCLRVEFRVCSREYGEDKVSRQERSSRFRSIMRGGSGWGADWGSGCAGIGDLWGGGLLDGLGALAILATFAFGRDFCFIYTNYLRILVCGYSSRVKVCWLQKIVYQVRSNSKSYYDIKKSEFAKILI